MGEGLTTTPKVKDVRMEDGRKGALKATKSFRVKLASFLGGFLGEVVEFVSFKSPDSRLGLTVTENDKHRSEIQNLLLKHPKVHIHLQGTLNEGKTIFNIVDVSS